jgi:hypothetical protein
MMHVHDVVSDYNSTAAAKADKHIPRAVAIACTDDFIVDLFRSPPFVLAQLSGPWLQPASAAFSSRVLGLDILEVSHLCGCMY